MRPRPAAATAALALSLAALAASPAAAAVGGAEGLPNVDRRTAERAPVPQSQSAARRRLDAELGPEGEVRTDRASGGVAYVGRTDALLTGRSTAAPRDVVLDYVREHGDAFGLRKGDYANLRLVARDVSPDGITHLRFNQTLDGVESFDSGLEASVTADGRLINVSGAPVPGAALPSTTPELTAGQSLGAAREAVETPGLPPRTTDVRRGPSRTTTFANGDRAVLRWSATADGPRLAWNVITTADDGHGYDVLVDARTGDLLRRQSVTQHLGQARVFRADPGQPGSTPGTFAPPVTLTMPPAWYDDSAGGTRLWGQYARTYVDPRDEDPAAGVEDGGTRVQIPASGGAPSSPDWLYAQSTAFSPPGGCPASGCTWDSTVDGASPPPATPTSSVNRFQASVNAHVLASRYHDYLAAAPIGFDEASGNFQRTNAGGAGLGGDYVRVETNDGQYRPVIAGDADSGPTFNNANFSTPPDGQAPRMQMFLWDGRDVNGSDDASVVYHEYGHGLSNRLVVTASGASGLGSAQASMMGEAWSDFYALDLLQHEGAIPADTAAPGDVRLGTYVVGPDGIRAKPIDCPVDASSVVAACNRYASGKPAVVGGYTYGDLAGTQNASPHNGGEVWGETLWDLRTALVAKLGDDAGRTAALRLVTGGMRLSVVNPSMLDMRDAILQQAVAMRSAPGATDDLYADVWEVFRKRGMGAKASTPSASSTAPTESFDAPAGIRADGVPVVSDPYPGGDADGTIEPGEEFRVTSRLTGIGTADLPGVTGVLNGPAALGLPSPSASWPVLGKGRTAANATPLAGRVPVGQCSTKSPLTLDITSTEGKLSLPVTVDPRPGSSTAVPLRDGGGTPEAPEPRTTTATFVARGTGAIDDVDVRIDELRHTYLGDLQLAVVSPKGTVVQLTNNWGNPNFGGDDVLDAVFDDGAATLAAPADGAPGPITGPIKPVGSLTSLRGEPAAGTWTLRITDTYPEDSGTLRRWGLTSPQVDCGRAEIPTATTTPAGGVAQTAATLNGAVTPNGRATGLRFAYGTTTAYGQTTPTQDVGAGDAAQARSAGLTGLAPDTVYHYRVEALREGGQVAVTGADGTFRTAAAGTGDPGTTTTAPTTPTDPGTGGGGSTGGGGTGAGGSAGGGGSTGGGTAGGGTTGGGTAGAVGPTTPADRTAPRLSAAKVTLKRVGRTSRRRATFRFALTEPGRVTAAVVRTGPGVREGSRCVAVPRRRPAKARSCVRETKAVTTTLAIGRPGTGKTLALPAKGLPRGSYVARLTATDAAGNRSAVAKVAFRVR